MALGPREFVEEVEKFSDLIEQKKTQLKEINPKSKIRLGDIDVSDVIEDVFEITVALQRLYIMQPSINNLSSWDTVKIVKKARLISLLGVCQFFKDYNNKSEYSFWELYSQEAGFTVNDNFFTKIIEPALIEEGIVNASFKSSESLISIISKESALSESYIEDIICLFNVYLKLYYPGSHLTSYIADLKLKQKSSLAISKTKTFIDKEGLFEAMSRITKIEEKSIFVINELLNFTNFIEFEKEIPTIENIDSLIVSFGEKYKTDISLILKTDQLKKQYLKTIPSVSLFKFTALLKLPENQELELFLPDNSKVKVSDFIKSEDKHFGIYKLKDSKVSVMPSMAYDIDFFSLTERDKLQVLGNKVALRSFHPFTPKLDSSVSESKPQKLFKNNKFDGFLWFIDRPITHTINIVSEKVPILALEPSEKIVADLSLKLFNELSAPTLKLSLSHLILISPENKSKKLEIFNTDQTAMLNEFSLDKQGIGFSGQIDYEIKNKKPSLIDLYLFSEGKAASLKEFEPRISCFMEETLLFNQITKTKIAPSINQIESSVGKLYLFTVKNYDGRWFNDVCEVSSFQSFGKYNVYEIDWIDRSKPLEININAEYKWRFINTFDLKVEVKGNRNHNKFIEFKDNQFSTLKDLNIILSCKEENLSIKDLDLRLSVDFNTIVSRVKIGYVNALLDRNENHGIIDDLFLKTLIKTEKDLTNGRYELQFYYNSGLLAKYEFFIIPSFEVLEESDIYLEGEEVILTLNSDAPCFKNNKISQSYLFDKPARCDFAFNQHIIESRKIRYHKKARIYNPFTEFDLVYEPDIIGFRFIFDNRIFSTDTVDFYQLDKKTLLLKTPHKEARLKVNNNVVKPLQINNMGISIEPLKSVQDYLFKPSNEVSFQIGRNEVSFQVLWNPKVTLFSCDSVLFAPDKGIDFNISYQGPSNSYLKLSLGDENGNMVDIKKVFCGDDTAPKFVRFDRSKNCIYIICDGKSWEDRTFTIFPEQSQASKLEYLYLRGDYDYNNTSFGELIFKNQSFEPETQEINQKIAEDPNNPYLYFERGFIYTELNNFIIAESDFKKSIKLGLDDPEAKNYIELFTENLSDNRLAYELLQITNLAKKLYTEELLLDVE